MKFTEAEWRSVSRARMESEQKQKRVQWTTPMVRQLKELMEQGMSTKKAAEEIGVTIEQAQRARQRYIINGRGPAESRWTDEHMRQAQELLDAGHTISHAANTLGCSRQTISRRTKRRV